MSGSLRCLFIAFTFHAATLLHAQTMDAATRGKIDELIQRCLATDGAPSASVAIVLANRLVYANAFGNAVLSPAAPATRNTRYQLASLSKSFTAQAVLLLAAEGKLSLDDPVSRWYPDLTGATHITVRQLLNHTSGYPDHYPESYPAGPRGAAATPDSIIAEWGHHALLFPPGTRYSYSNLEYEIAGRIVEKVSGEPLFELMQARIFKPAGMTGALDLDTLAPGSMAVATGYIRHALAPLDPAPYEGPGWSFGAGQVLTTAEDLARWDVAFLERRILPEPQATEEVTPARLLNGSVTASALGLFVSNQDGVRRYYHTGQGLGFLAANMIYPDAHLAFVVLTNTSASGTVIKILDQLTYILLPPTGNELFARHIFAGLQSGQPDLVAFSDNLKRHMSGALSMEYRSSLSALGPVESFGSARTKTEDHLESRDYDITAGGHPLKLHLLLLPDGKLEDVTVTDAAID